MPMPRCDYCGRLETPPSFRTYSPTTPSSPPSVTARSGRLVERAVRFYRSGAVINHRQRTVRVNSFEWLTALGDERSYRCIYAPHCTDRRSHSSGDRDLTCGLLPKPPVLLLCLISALLSLPAVLKPSPPLLVCFCRVELLGGHKNFRGDARGWRHSWADNVQHGHRRLRSRGASRRSAIRVQPHEEEAHQARSGEIVDAYFRSCVPSALLLLDRGGNY